MTGETYKIVIGKRVGKVTIGDSSLVIEKKTIGGTDRQTDAIRRLIKNTDVTDELRRRSDLADLAPA